jgi:hypothetical protein
MHRAPLEYASPSRARPASFLSVYSKLFGGIILALIVGVWMFLPSLGRARMPAQVVKCSSHLRQIGQACAAYANDNGGRYPEYIHQIALDNSPSILLCPTSKERLPPRHLEGAELLAHIANNPGHVSYTYIGRGLTLDAPPHTVVAYEVLGHHPPKEGHKIDGSNVLFADNKVVFVAAKDLKTLINELATGANPPPIAKTLHDSAP